MKKILLTLALGAMSLFTYAENDNVKITQTSNGSSTEITVSLVDADAQYTAFGIDVKLPAGMTITKDAAIETENGVYYVSDEDESLPMTHQLYSTFGKVDSQTLRVACISTGNQPFENKSGELFKFTVSGTGTATLANVDLIEKPMMSFNLVADEGDEELEASDVIDVDDVQELFDKVMSAEGVDVNGDGNIDVDDVQYLFDYALGKL